MLISDGHGEFGHYVSSFLKDNLPLVVEEGLAEVQDNDPKSKEFQTALEKSFKKATSKLETESKIDIQLSGSTCCSVILTPTQVVCANCGDSRAIIGRKTENGWKAVHISKDHKPGLPQEKMRIEISGGRVEPYRDDDGEFLGPDRVWLKKEDLPGLAMSRSFGDKLASSVGVISKPEIICENLVKEDKFMVIASDGIWDFVKSEEVCDIVGKYVDDYDIKGACTELVRTSCTRWLEEEDTLDDTTVIIVFFI